MQVQPLSIPSQIGLRPPKPPSWHFRWSGLGEAERRVALLGGDALAIAAGCLASLPVTGIPRDPGLCMVATGLALTIGGLFITMQYALVPSSGRALGPCAALGGIAMLSTGASLGLGWPALTAAALGTLLSGICLAASRLFLQWLLATRTRRRVLLCCDPGEAEEMASIMSHQALAGWMPLGTVADPSGRPHLPPLLYLGAPEQLPDLVETYRVDTIVAGLSWLRQPAWRRMLPIDLPIESAPALYERLSRRIPLGWIDQAWFLENFPWQRGWLYEVGKRSLDMMVAATALLVLLPLAIMLLTTRRPLIAAPHVGRHGKTFQRYHFRPEPSTLPSWERLASRLPALVHLFKGDLTLVGPAPASLPEAAAQEAEPFYGRRFLVRPGLFGLAQLHGASSDRRALEYDLFYLKHRSLTLDLELAVTHGARCLWRLIRGSHSSDKEASCA